MTVQKMTRIVRSVQRRWDPLYSALYSALVCAVLAVSLGLSCDKLEQLDKESDKVLNEINAPGGSSSSSESSSSSSSGSGLTVVKRKAMPLMTMKDTRGRPVEVWGQSESASTTPGHSDTIAALAIEMAGSGKYEFVTMQRSWRTATGRVSKSGRIPDVIGVRRDGKVDAYEVISKSDNRDALMQRLEEGMNTLPPKRRGRYDVIKPYR